MKRNWLKAVVVLVALSLAGNAVAVTWTGAGSDDLWSNPFNWDTGTPPQDGDGSVSLNANNDAGNDLAVIDSSTNVTVNLEIYGPEWGMHLDINGGSLTQIHTSDPDPWNGFVFAPVADADAHSTIDVHNGGNLHVQEMLIGDNWWFSGHPYVDLTVSDTSTVFANGWCWLGGKMNLEGGTVDIGGAMNVATANGYAGIDIEDGTLIIRNRFADGRDLAAEAADWYANGYLTGFGGTGLINIDTTTITDGVVITATIPEPATMLIFGLGTLLISRKRKA